MYITLARPDLLGFPPVGPGERAEKPAAKILKSISNQVVHKILVTLFALFSVPCIPHLPGSHTPPCYFSVGFERLRLAQLLTQLKRSIGVGEIRGDAECKGLKTRRIKLQEFCERGFGISRIGSWPATGSASRR